MGVWIEFQRREAKIISEAIRIIGEEAQAPDRRFDYSEAKTNADMAELAQVATRCWQDGKGWPS